MKDSCILLERGICMVLTNEEAKRFYKLWIPLLDFVNQKYKINRNLFGMTSPIGLPIIEIRKISEKLWDDKRVIDEYILSGFKALDEEETEIVSSWKRAVRGGFIVDRHLWDGSVLISIENSEVYIVKGIVSSWREILEGFPMPQAVEATLIPFGNVIIFDGIITSSSSRVCLGRNMSEQSKQIYLNAKKNGKLHYCL